MHFWPSVLSGEWEGSLCYVIPFTGIFFRKASSTLSGWKKGWTRHCLKTGQTILSFFVEQVVRYSCDRTTLPLMVRALQRWRYVFWKKTASQEEKSHLKEEMHYDAYQDRSDTEKWAPKINSDRLLLFHLNIWSHAQKPKKMKSLPTTCTESEEEVPKLQPVSRIDTQAAFESPVVKLVSRSS